MGRLDGQGRGGHARRRAPFGARAAVVDNGTSAEPSALQGYSIVEAENLDAAKALADGHPFLSEGNGRFSLEIFELIDMGI
ncbi:YciI family protein [Arthrobacter sp. SDTb3-6]|uniref:YciI family protein n=1 Tax=Arthrobacter sp. SDTb3-6 TaxID=2713571 RepID=UPI00159D7F10|nr:YciI family protein [Arthrobacter sp. SDTb3-6]NVN00633.1 hypothetical protein [Arthrobacter sp. SDTb3-6]